MSERRSDEQRRGDAALQDMAILVRAGFQTREFEDRFITLGLPYRVVGGPRFYERQEIRDALAYLRLIHQPDDGLAFERIVNRPKRGLGDRSLQILHAHARARSISLTRAARDYAEKEPPFAVGLLAFHWLVQGYGYEITGADVWAAYSHTLKAAEKQGTVEATQDRIRTLVATEAPGECFVNKILGRELEL